MKTGECIPKGLFGLIMTWQDIYMIRWTYLRRKEMILNWLMAVWKKHSRMMNRWVIKLPPQLANVHSLPITKLLASTRLSFNPIVTAQLQSNLTQHNTKLVLQGYWCVTHPPHPTHTNFYTTSRQPRKLIFNSSSSKVTFGQNPDPSFDFVFFQTIWFWIFFVLNSLKSCLMV